MTDRGNHKVGNSGDAADVFQKFECPFTWNFPPLEKPSMGERVLKNLSDEEDHPNVFQSFVYYILSIYDSASINRNNDKAMDILEKYRSIYEDILQNENMMGCQLAIKHIMNSCEAFLHNNNAEEIDLVASDIPPTSELDDTNKAAILGLKAAMWYEFGPEATVPGIEWAARATVLDPENGEWHFQKGKGLQRKRTKDDRYSLPSREEMYSLEAAIEKTNSPTYMVFLAKCYTDAMNSLSGRNHRVPNDKKKLFSDMGNRVLELCELACKEAGNSWYILMRSGMCLHKLPIPFKNTGLAEKYLEKAFQIRPHSGILCHQLGSLISRKYKESGNPADRARARELLNVAVEAGIYGAAMDLIRLYPNPDKSYNVSAEMERYANLLQQDDRATMYAHLGTYLLFVENHHSNAIRAYVKAVKCVRNPRVLQEYSPTVLNSTSYGKFSIFQLVEYALVYTRDNGIPLKVDVDEAKEVMRNACQDAVGRYPNQGIKQMVRQAFKYM